MNKEVFLKLADEYVDSKKLSWSDNTANSERYRLKAIDPKYLEDADSLYKYLTEEREMKPYAVKTTLIRVGEFLQWAIDGSKTEIRVNGIKAFMQANARLFKHAYTRKPLEIDFDQVKSLIKRVEDEPSRNKAIELLHTGMRWEESLKISEDGMIVGKGNKPRKIYLDEGGKPVEFAKSYATFLYHLKKVGLTPHMLRKACASKLTEMGADGFDLCKIMGWTSLQTATSYIESKKAADMMAALHKFSNEGEANAEKQTSGAIPKTRKPRK